MIFFMKNPDLDLIEHKKLTDNSLDNLPIQTSWGKVKHLITNKLFMLASFSVCVAFFVVVGIQFWGTSYMIITMDLDPHNAMITYAFITITAPILGLIFSGFVLDSLGGYKGSNRITALKLMLFFSLLCLIISVPTSYIYNVFLFAPLLWMEIFLGACTIPAGVGIVVDSVST